MEKTEIKTDIESADPAEVLAKFKKVIQDLNELNLSGVISMGIVISFLPDWKETIEPLDTNKIPDGSTVRTMVFTGGHEPTLYKGAAKLQTDLALRRMKRDGAPQEAIDIVEALSEAVINGKDITELAQRLEFITDGEGTLSEMDRKKLN